MVEESKTQAKGLLGAFEKEILYKAYCKKCENLMIQNEFKSVIGKVIDCDGCHHQDLLVSVNCCNKDYCPICANVTLEGEPWIDGEGESHKRTYGQGYPVSNEADQGFNLKATQHHTKSEKYPHGAITVGREILKCTKCKQQSRMEINPVGKQVTCNKCKEKITQNSLRCPTCKYDCCSDSCKFSAKYQEVKDTGSDYCSAGHVDGSAPQLEKKRSFFQKIGDLFSSEPQKCLEVLTIQTIKWSWYGTKGQKPKIDNNYAGLIVYDVGSFKWKEVIRPGYACIVDVKELPWQDQENRAQPHRPLTRFLFGKDIQTLQNEYGMKLAGFALNGEEFTVNSGAFNTHAIGGHGINGFQDTNKSMNEKESQLVVGAFVACIRKGWPVEERTSFLGVDECMNAGSHFPRRQKYNSVNGVKNEHQTAYYDEVYGLYNF